MRTTDQEQRQGRSSRAIEDVAGGCWFWAAARGARVGVMTARERAGRVRAGEIVMVERVCEQALRDSAIQSCTFWFRGVAGETRSDYHAFR